MLRAQLSRWLSRACRLPAHNPATPTHRGNHAALSILGRHMNTRVIRRGYLTVKDEQRRLAAQIGQLDQQGNWEEVPAAVDAAVRRAEADRLDLPIPDVVKMKLFDCYCHINNGEKALQVLVEVANENAPELPTLFTPSRQEALMRALQVAVEQDASSEDRTRIQEAIHDHLSQLMKRLSLAGLLEPLEAFMTSYNDLTGLDPGPRQANALLQAFARKSLTVEMTQTYEVMMERQMEIDLETWVWMVTGFHRGKLQDRALEVLQRVHERAGADVARTVKLHSLLLLAHQQEGSQAVDGNADLLSFITSLVDKNHLDVLSEQGIMDVLSWIELEGAWQVTPAFLAAVTLKGGVIPGAGLPIVVSAFSNLGDADKTIGYMKEMKDRGQARTVPEYEALLKAYATHAQPDLHLISEIGNMMLSGTLPTSTLCLNTLVVMQVARNAQFNTPFDPERIDEQFAQLGHPANLETALIQMLYVGGTGRGYDSLMRVLQSLTPDESTAIVGALKPLVLQRMMPVFQAVKLSPPQAQETLAQVGFTGPHLPGQMLAQLALSYWRSDLGQVTEYLSSLLRDHQCRLDPDTFINVYDTIGQHAKDNSAEQGVMNHLAAVSDSLTALTSQYELDHIGDIIFARMRCESTLGRIDQAVQLARQTLEDTVIIKKAPHYVPLVQGIHAHGSTEHVEQLGELWALFSRMPSIQDSMNNEFYTVCARTFFEGGNKAMFNTVMRKARLTGHAVDPSGFRKPSAV